MNTDTWKGTPTCPLHVEHPSSLSLYCLHFSLNLQLEPSFLPISSQMAAASGE